MITTLLDGFFAAARENKRPFGFMSLLTDTGALPGVEVTAAGGHDFFAETRSRLGTLASELRQRDYDFMDLLEDNGQIPQLFALTGIRSIANDVEAASDRPAPKSPVAPKAA